MLAVMNDSVGGGGGPGPRARIHYSNDRRAAGRAGREWTCREEACGRRERVREACSITTT